MGAQSESDKDTRKLRGILENKLKLYLINWTEKITHLQKIRTRLEWYVRSKIAIALMAKNPGVRSSLMFEGLSVRIINRASAI